jgi:rhamnulokinase
MTTAHLAIDLGAGSGRAIVGLLDVHGQFVENGGSAPVRALALPHAGWTGMGSDGNLVEHLAGTPRKANDGATPGTWRLSSVGVDAWGVDWCLVGRSGELLALPHCYRDPQNEAAMEECFNTSVEKKDSTSETGSS